MDKQKNIDKFSILLKKWQSVINKMKTRDDDAFMKTGEKASADEIANLEMESGFKLPPSFSDAISGIGKSFDLSYSFYDYVLPDELGEIFSGRLSWDVSNFMSMYEYLGLIEYENNDDVEAKTYAEKMKNLCQFSCSGNGDVYVFDMSCEALEKSVLYWNHETDEITYLANSFGEYLEKITELYCVGNEIWQFEEFLDKNGLCPDSEKAQNWKKWFECFTTTELTDVAGNLDDLFQFAICRKNMDEQVIAALRLYGKALLFEKLKETLKEGVQRQEAACKMMALLIGDYAQEWLIYFWNNAEVSKVKHSTWLKLGDINILPALLSYLSANCMDKTMGAEYVKRFLEVQGGNDMDISAYAHLKYFDAEQVIPWMEARLGNRPDWWGRLFIAVKPEWETFLRWSKRESKYQSALAEGLHCFISGSAYEIVGLPPKEEFRVFLDELKEGQLLFTRKKKIDEVAANIDRFYEASL